MIQTKRRFLTVSVHLHRRLDRPVTTLLLLLMLWAAGCTRHVNVSKEMTWECSPEDFMPEYPEAQPVRFTYVENPSYYDVVPGKGLCDQLKASGKRVVVVQFETHGNSSRGLIGYHEVAVDGKPIINAGGWGYSGAHEPSGWVSGAHGNELIGPHPLEELYKSSGR